MNDLQRECPDMTRNDATRSAWFTLYGYDPHQSKSTA